MSEPSAVILSYYNINANASGGARRVQQLVEACSQEGLLIQPGKEHPAQRSRVFEPDWGRTRRGINWGMFNFFHPRTARFARNVVKETAPRTLVLTSMWCWAPFRKGSWPRMILDAQNVDALAIEERYGVAHPFTRLVESWERRVVHAVDHIFTCSDVDRQEFMRRYGCAADRLTVIPNGADMPAAAALATPESLPEELESWLGSSQVLVFVGGKLDYPPNTEGLMFLVQEIMPRLEQAHPGRFKLLVFGTPQKEDLQHPAVRQMGRVPSLQAYLKRADLCLAPIFSGSGTRLKIIDYLAHARPVLSTPKGAEGLELIPDTHLVLAKRESFLENILLLCSDAEKRCRLGEAGRSKVQAEYDWAQIREQWRTGIRG